MRVDYLDPEQAANLQRHLTTPYNIIWEIGYSTGLRVSDILRLKAGQLTKPQARIREKKTGKVRIFYVSVGIRKKVELYRFGKPWITDSSLLFRVSRQTVWRQFKQAAERSGIKTNVGTHTMRKSYSNKYIAKGHNIKELQARLNHELCGDTQGYILSNAALGLDEHGVPKRKRKHRKGAKAR